MKLNGAQRVALAAFTAFMIAAGSTAFTEETKVSTSSSTSSTKTEVKTSEVKEKAEKKDKERGEKKDKDKDKKKEVAEPATYDVDPVHSAVIFRVSHMDVSFVFGRFNNAKGTVTWNEKDPEKSQIDVSVQVDDIDTHSEARDKHLKSADFFDAEKYPTITFKSTSIKLIDKEKGKYELKGDLTVKDVTKNVTTTFKKTGEGKDPWGGYRVGGLASLSINKQDFNVKGVPGVGDTVDMTIAIEAQHKQ